MIRMMVRERAFMLSVRIVLSLLRAGYSPELEAVELRRSHADVQPHRLAGEP